MGEEQSTLYTIGHSNLGMDRFLEYLRLYGITALVDTRTRPQSRYFPWFNRRNLSAQLDEIGVRYSFIDYQYEGEAIKLLHHDRANAKQKVFDNCLGGYPKDASVYPVPGFTGPKAVKAMDVETERPAFYEQIMMKDWFRRGIEQLLTVMDDSECVAILCACRDWQDCHRENLIASYFATGAAYGRHSPHHF